jgi:stage V sporulation protein B
LDIVVDHLLKGLDQQLASLRYNFTDAMLRVALVLFLIPYFGTKGYLCILFCSTIYNVSLSFHRLIKTTVVDLSLLRSVGLPLLSGTVAVSCTRLLLSVLPDGVPSVVLLSLGLLLSLALYIVLLYLSGSVRREDLLWAKTMVK